MEHFSFKNHFGRLVRELFREAKSGFIESALKRSVFWPLEAHSPLE